MNVESVGVTFTLSHEIEAHSGQREGDQRSGVSAPRTTKERHCTRFVVILNNFSIPHTNFN
jgi:hypothetical protein